MEREKYEPTLEKNLELGHTAPRTKNAPRQPPLLPPSLATMTATTTVFSFFFFFLFPVVRFPENLRLFKARYFKRNWRYEGMRQRGGSVDRVEDYTAESILPDTRRR